MKILGLEIGRRRIVDDAFSKSMQSIFAPSNWFGMIREPFTGAWQQNASIDGGATLLTFSAVYCCVTAIATDVAKLRIKLERQNDDGIWIEEKDPSPFAPVLRKPNHFQNRIQFLENWVISKLLAGNAYILKLRDNRTLVTDLYVLDPTRVTPLITTTGDVYYRLTPDYLSQIPNGETVPASEIIHDRLTPLWHPLIGVSPLAACALSATQGNRIQAQSTSLFGNQARPGGILSVPGNVTEEQAKKLKADFESGFSGSNVGRLAVLGNNMKFEPMIMAPQVLQLIEQLKWTVEDVGRAFHFPPYKLGGSLPPYSSSPQALTMMYYTDCLQTLIEAIELLLDEGLALAKNMGTELDIDNLMRMDTAALYESNDKGVGGGWMSPDEARFRANMPKTKGGDSPLMQQQNYSLAALAKRDARPDPFAGDPSGKSMGEVQELRSEIAELRDLFRLVLP